jgi:hypothetical protein
MNRPVQIRMLTEHETAELTNTAKFNALRPICCKKCGNTRNFGRRVFWIGGVPKAEQNSDSTQGLIAYHLKERYGVGSVFFKTYRNKFYVDSAECKRCGSTVIEFDIELSDEVLAEVSKLAGRPIEELRSEIQGLAERIAENNRNAEQGAPPDIPDRRAGEL